MVLCLCSILKCSKNRPQLSINALKPPPGPLPTQTLRPHYWRTSVKQREWMRCKSLQLPVACGFTPGTTLQRSTPACRCAPGTQCGHTAKNIHLTTLSSVFTTRCGWRQFWHRLYAHNGGIGACQYILLAVQCSSRLNNEAISILSGFALAA